MRHLETTGLGQPPRGALDALGRRGGGVGAVGGLRRLAITARRQGDQEDRKEHRKANLAHRARLTASSQHLSQSAAFSGEGRHFPYGNWQFITIFKHHYESDMVARWNSMGRSGSGCAASSPPTSGGRSVEVTWGGDVVTETRTGREWGLASLIQLAASTPGGPLDRDGPVALRLHRRPRGGDTGAVRGGRPRLRVRLGPRPPHISMYTWRRVAAGLVETLMLQLHGAARNVPPETVAGWEVDPEVVWKKARDNTLWDDPVDRELMISPKAAGSST